ncbi:MAG: tripartite tricarboxylate transporter TctB family protein [Pseudolabrys sp.]|jgi:putative tricarboxylic transport membrane protein
MNDVSNNEETQGGVTSNRTMNIVVALALMTVSVIVMVASWRLGAGWEPNVGPGSGYFPFYVALIMLITSTATLLQNLFFAGPKERGSFIAYHEMIMVLQVLVPMTIFVILSIYIGIYISTFLFITFFMTWHGRYPLWKTIPVAVLVPIALFIIFEIWFLVPLPKGPFEHWIGY